MAKFIKDIILSPDVKRAKYYAPVVAKAITTKSTYFPYDPSFKIGDGVYGYTSNRMFVSGNIVSIDKDDPQGLYFEILDAGTNIRHWCREVIKSHVIARKDPCSISASFSKFSK